MIFQRQQILTNKIHRFFMVFFAISWLFVISVFVSHAQVPTTAITSDGTLGTDIKQNGNVFNISEGTIVGGNQFHSFGLFSVGEADIANFNGPSVVENIVSRVTGGIRSEVFGGIHSTIDGANLFLMNPAGILFGPNASLDITGSFFATTANFFRLGENEIFHSDLNESSVLTMSRPEAFGFLGQAMPVIDPASTAAIRVEGLDARESEPVVLVSRDSRAGIDGAIVPGIQLAGGTLQNPGGSVALTSVDSPGEAFLENKGLRASPVPALGTFDRLGQVTISDNAALDASGAIGGGVVIRGGRLLIDESKISSNSMGSTEVPPGDQLEKKIDIQVTTEIALENGSIIEANVFDGSSNGVNITLKADESIQVGNGSLVQTIAFGGSGNAGDIEVEADSIGVSGGILGSLTFSPATGKTGSVRVNANDLQVMGGVISAASIGSGDARDVEVTVSGGEILVSSDGAIGSSSFDSGDAGNVQITSQNLQLVNGARIQSIAESTTETANAGNVTVMLTGSLNVKEGSRVNVGSASGASGNLIISAQNIVVTGVLEAVDPQVSQFTGIEIFTKPDSGPSGDLNITATNLQLTDKSFIRHSTLGSENGGDIIIRLTENLLLDNGGEILNFTSGIGNAGDIVVEANNIDLLGKNTFPIKTPDGGDSLAFALITTQNQGGNGDAGNIQITANRLNILDGAAIDSRTLSNGDGGRINIVADRVLISGENATKKDFLITRGLNPERGLSNITTESEGRIPGPEATGIAGNIDIRAGTVELDQGVINARSATAGAGGSIQVSAEELSVSNNSSITAESAFTGNAGNIDLLANNTILIDNSVVKTEATEASGGNITMQAVKRISLKDTTISSSVQGNATTVGGNISIDPEFIILENSQILAKAVEGQGGNISLVATNAVLVDPLSDLDASSALGVSGSVDIQAPIQNLSGTIAPLPEEAAPVTALYGARCAAGHDGNFSTFVDSKAESLSTAPGTFLSSPLLPLSAQASSTTKASNAYQGPVILTASLAPLVLGQGDPTMACP